MTHLNSLFFSNNYNYHETIDINGSNDVLTKDK